MSLSVEELHEFLDEKANQYNHPRFIKSDPIQIPHLYSRKEDIEIAGFLTATISWGQRSSIIKSAGKMMSFLGDSPYDFIMSHKKHQLERIDGSVHRTFNATDLLFFIRALQHLYQKRGGLESIFNQHQTPQSLQPAIHQLKQEFLAIPHPLRSSKHLPDPFKGSAAKRINMWLRWMVRKDNRGVDFGLWENIPASILSCPLDVHSGNVARKLGLIERRQNDSKALSQLDKSLRQMDPLDPVKYDFALFGLGVFEKF